jgi:hypothetical protein
VPALPLPLLLALAQAAPGPSAPPVSSAPAAAPVSPAPAAAPAPDLSAGTAPAPVVAAPVAAPAPERKPAPEHGPFFAPEPASETAYATALPREAPPRFSVGRGAFCFVDDAKCKASLILTADIGVGINAVTGTESVQLPYAQLNFRGGLVLKPLTLIKGNGWHPWAIGLAGGWSRGTPHPPGSTDERLDVRPITAGRVFVVNQLWLSQKRNGFHLDLDLGLVRSTVAATSQGRFLGTHAALSANWGGWGGVFIAGDFLDHDTRVVLGFRGHGIPAAPVIGLVLLGLLAGGGF